MKQAMIFLSLALVGIVQGQNLSDYWYQGSSAVGPIQLEPNLSGDELFLSLTSNIGWYMTNLQNALYDQFGNYMNYYAGGASMRNYLLTTALNNIDDNTPSDAFDVMIANHTDFFSEFLFNIRDYASKSKEKKPSPISAYRSSSLKPKTKAHELNDFLSYFDLVLSSDLSMLSAYIDEMLYLGKKRILENYQEFEKLFRTGIPTVYGQMKRYMETSNKNIEKIRSHTSNWIFQNYEKVKAEVAKIDSNKI